MLPFSISIYKTHEALVDADMFERAQQIRLAGKQRPTTHKRPRVKRTYQLSGLIRCGLCGRRMQGSFNNGREHYRCQYASEYAIAKGIDHPKTVYLREDRITDALDAWLATMFDEATVDATCDAMSRAQEPDDALAARREAARRRIADCDRRLDRHRAALEAGADALIVAGWMREVQRERLAAEHELGNAAPAQAPLTANEVRALIGGVQDAVALLGRADPKLKADMYAELGIELTYQPDKNLVKVRAQPCRTVCVGGGTCTLTPRAFRPSEYSVAA